MSRKVKAFFITAIGLFLISQVWIYSLFDRRDADTPLSWISLDVESALTWVLVLLSIGFAVFAVILARRENKRADKTSP